METVCDLNILGVSYSAHSSYNSKHNIENRIACARRAIYRYATAGMVFPGYFIDVKVHLWNRIGVRRLTYGMKCIII